MNWRVIDATWEGFREAFAGFDPVTVAEYGPADVARLLADPRVIRNRPKVEGTVENARALIELDAEHGGFGRYLQSRDGFRDTVADLKRQFWFIGDSGAYHFLWQVGEPVPDYDTWQAT
jgi:DNA-3-methyladenine glycosylase I